MNGELSALGCAFIWALSAVFTKSLAPKFHPLSLNFLRCLGASILLWGLIPLYPGVPSLFQAPASSLLYLEISALLGICLGDTIYIKALNLINANLAFPLAQSSMPLFTLAAAVLFLGETMSWFLGLGAGLVIGGSYLIANPGRPGTPSRVVPPHPKKGLGISLILVASACWTVSISLLKLGLQGVNPILANGVRLPLAALILALLAWRKGENSRSGQAGVRDACLGAFSGALSFGVGGILFILAIQYAGAGKAAVLTSSAPLFGLPLAALYLKERVTLRICSGTALVVAGIFFLI